MNFDFHPDVDAWREDLRTFLTDHLPDPWRGADATDGAWKWTKEFTSVLGDRGWLTPMWPTEYGGDESSIWHQVAAQEEYWAHNEPRGPQYMTANWIGPAIIHFGTDQQKATYLPPMSRGEVIWAQGFSESEAGSDLAGLRTRAEVTDDGFVVSGRKVWISHGTIADHIFLLCRTLPGSERKEGLSVLLVDMNNPAVTATELPSPLGHHRQTEILFDEAAVPSEALLGELHDGWNVAMTALSFERTGVPRYARSARLLHRAACAFAATHEEQGADSPTRLSVEKFAETVALARATELSNYAAVAAREQDRASRAVSSVARVHNGMLEQSMADLLEDSLGFDAILAGDDPHAPWNGEAESLWRNAPATTVAAGALEIQLEVLASEALGLER